VPLLSIAQQIALARKHGFTVAELPDVCAVVMTESGGKTDAVQKGGFGRGLVQIDLGQHPDVTEAQAFDPDFAMAFARRLSRNAHGLGPTNYQPTLTWDPVTGEIIELLPADVGGAALEHPGGTSSTNNHGDVHIQVEAYFTPGVVRGGVRYATLLDTPLAGLDRILAWTDGWGIPRVAPLAPGARNESVWRGTAGHYGHFNTPSNTHFDPIVAIGDLLAKGTPTQEDDMTADQAKQLAGLADAIGNPTLGVLTRVAQNTAGIQDIQRHLNKLDDMMVKLTLVAKGGAG